MLNATGLRFLHRDQNVTVVREAQILLPLEKLFGEQVPSAQELCWRLYTTIIHYIYFYNVYVTCEICVYAAHEVQVGVPMALQQMHGLLLHGDIFPSAGLGMAHLTQATTAASRLGGSALWYQVS